MHRVRWSFLPFMLAVLAVALIALFVAAPGSSLASGESTAAHEVIANGLANPRGLIFGPDGALYVAEAGSGGAGPCMEGPEGEVCLGDTGAITKVTFDAEGEVTGQAQLVTGVVSLAFPGSGNNATGPHDVAFDSAGDLYFIVGLGNDPAVRGAAGPLGADSANLGQLVAADKMTGDWMNEVDVAAYEAAENPDGGVPDSNPYGLIWDGSTFVVADAGANAALGVTPAGVISTLAVLPPRMVEFPPGSGGMIPMQAVPTATTIGPDGALYIAQLTGFPFPPGGANIYRVEAGEEPEIYLSGFTNVLDLEFAADGSLYVVEMFTNGILSENPTGAIKRIDPDGSRTIVAREGLITPGGLTIGPDHALYVSNLSTSGSAGQVLRIPTRLSEATVFTAFLGGGQEVPPVDTDASGVARFTLDSTDTLNFEVAVEDISGITASHIHLGAPGENGGVVLTLYDGTGPFDPDNPISGTLPLTEEQYEDLLAGDYYVNVHTTANPGGEIRGQIYPAEIHAFRAGLSGSAEVPPVQTDAFGEALLTLSPDMTQLYYRVMVEDIDNITLSHIHEAPAGQNGGVIFTLFDGSGEFDPDNPISGMVEPTLQEVATMLAGDYYVNVHTTEHPGGEIRGQIETFDPARKYVAALNGEQEVPPVDTEATGAGQFMLSPDLGTLDYQVVVSDIDNITAAHLHTGWPGQNGGVAHTLYDGTGPFDPENPASGLLPFDAESVLDLISGYYYANVHTESFSGGEIRGQVGRMQMPVYLPVVASDK